MSKSTQDADRGYINWKPNKRTKEMLGQALEIVRSYSERGLPAPTPRDVLYDMVSYHGYEKDIQPKLYRLLRKARRAQMIYFYDLTDDTGAFTHLGGYQGVADFWTKDAISRKWLHKTFRRQSTRSPRVVVRG